MKKKYILLKLFLIESEKNNIIDFKSHYSLLKNCIIKFPLKIEGENNKENICEFFFDNTSLNDIKEKLSKKYKIPMNYIESYYINNEEKLKLDYTFNNQTLKEIILDKLNKNGGKNTKIDFNKILSFSKSQKENLLTGKELSSKFKNILSKWFKQFSDNNGKMDKKMFTTFISSINKDNAIQESDERIKIIFNKYDKNEKGYIIEEDFFKYYSDLLLKENKLNYCMENLNNMGYNEYLVKKR
jgi:Ca2+-binding EF-hand superfamily protein